MRNISSNGLAKLANKLGNEPIVIVEADWVDAVVGSELTTTVVSSAGPTIADITLGEGCITWSLSDLMGVGSKRLVVDGKDSNTVYGPYPTGAAGKSNFSGVTNLSTGDHTFAIYATDLEGRVSETTGTFTAARLTSTYADKTVQGIPGKIIEVADLDNVVNISTHSGSQSVSITLDDTDGSIKALFDTHDFHKRPVRIYQYFSGLDLNDKFLIFAGLINTPLTWSERDRTVKITVLSQLEDLEVGFSADEGNFPYLPASLVGKIWPSIFGKVINCPTLRINQAITGTTLNGIGIVQGLPEFAPIDNTAFNNSLLLKYKQAAHLMNAAMCWEPVDGTKYIDLSTQANKIYDEINAAIAQRLEQESCQAFNQAQQIALQLKLGNGGDTITILGGEDFPQGVTLTLNINGGLFTGSFNGQVFTISSRDSIAYEEALKEWEHNQHWTCKPPPRAQNYKFQTTVPYGSSCADGPTSCLYTDQGFIIPGQAPGSSLAPPMQQFWADPGSPVYIYGQEPKVYIASITPGTVLAVRAYKGHITTGTVLADVPKEYYTVETQNYGPVTAVQIRLNCVLSQLMEVMSNGELGPAEWSDDLYVSFESTVGPNVIDIYKYLITNYTTLKWDDASFDHCRPLLDRFPANFALLDRKNTLSVFQELAFQSRCAVWVSDGYVYLKYLAEVPTPVDTITVSDLDAEKSIEIGFTPTENIVTKMLVKWRISLEGYGYQLTSNNSSQAAERIIILRHNMKKYNMYEQSYDWYMFNQPDIIYKMATFWLIRYSIMWKTVKFQTFLNHLNLETFDAITLNLPSVATDPVTAVITKASYNSVDNCVDIECLTPVQAGTMVADPFFWPANLPSTVKWPTQADIDSGNAGGGGMGSEVAGKLPIGDSSLLNLPDEPVVFVGGQNVIFRAHSDWGDRAPNDADFTAQTIVDTSNFAGQSPSSAPTLNLQFPATAPLDPLPLDLPEAATITIDIRKTKVYDSAGDMSKAAYLSSIIKGVNSENKLLLDGTNMLISADSQDDGKTFDFRYDETGDQMGAGTAFLKDG